MKHILLCTTWLAVLFSSSLLADTSLDEAVSEARDRYPGRVLSAETRADNGHTTHNIRILTDEGHVRRLRMDAQSGQFRKKPRR